MLSSTIKNILARFKSKKAFVFKQFAIVLVKFNFPSSRVIAWVISNGFISTTTFLNIANAGTINKQQKKLYLLSLPLLASKHYWLHKNNNFMATQIKKKLRYVLMVNFKSLKVKVRKYGNFSFSLALFLFALNRAK
jgi:hypothetical protein